MIKLTDQELRDLLAKFAADHAIGFTALRESQAKTEPQIAKSDAKLSNLSAVYGGISENLGAATEEFFYNSLLDMPVVGGILTTKFVSIRA